MPLVAVFELSGREVHHPQVGVPQTVARGCNLPNEKGRASSGALDESIVGVPLGRTGRNALMFVGTRYVRRLQVSFRGIVRSPCGGGS